MTIERTEDEGYWYDFVIYCEDNGIGILHREDWEPWWMIWNAALDAADNAYLASIKQQPDDIQEESER